MSHALLAEIWLWILAAILVLYLATDGFDLGVGILALFTPEEQTRKALMDSIEGVWHANQTWLVILGGVLFGAFPKAYGQVFSGYYLPAAALLFALAARGIGLEYHYLAAKPRAWSNLFGAGSLASAALVGAMLGAALAGPDAAQGHAPEGVFAWVGLPALLGGLALPCMLGVLGGGWGVARVAGFAPQRLCLPLAVASLGLQAGLALVVPVSGFVGAALGLAALVYFCWLLLALTIGQRFFAPALCYLVGSLLAWAAAIRPALAWPRLSPLDAAAQPLSLTIMLVGFGIVLPVIAWYTVYQYRVFCAGPGHDAPAPETARSGS